MEKNRDKLAELFDFLDEKIKEMENLMPFLKDDKNEDNVIYVDFNKENK